jgi:ribosomal protein S20
LVEENFFYEALKKIMQTDAREAIERRRAARKKSFFSQKFIEKN